MKKKQKAKVVKESVATSELKRQLIKHLREIPIATYACQRVGVPKSTYYKWRKLDEVFLEVSNEAIKVGKLTLNDIAKSQLVKLIKQGDFRSVSFWLKHNDEDFNSKLTLKIEDGPRKYDPEELKELETAMFNAGLVGVTLAHQKMAEAFRLAEEKDKQKLLEQSEYDSDESEDLDREDKPPINIAKVMEKLKQREGAKKKDKD